MPPPLSIFTYGRRIVYASVRRQRSAYDYATSGYVTEAESNYDGSKRDLVFWKEVHPDSPGADRRQTNSSFTENLVAFCNNCDKIWEDHVNGKCLFAPTSWR